MSILKSVSYRSVLNSHVKFTNEFIVELADGSAGTGASPQGETISIYEDKKVTIEPGTIIETLRKDGLMEMELDQTSFDDYLQKHISFFGRNNVSGLSLAFFNALSSSASPFELFGKPQKEMSAPRISLNILNGGWHAYTNPVLSDFSEFMLVAKSDHVAEVIANHNEIQREVRERFLRQKKTVVSGNPVNCFEKPDNRDVIEFLLKVTGDLGLSDQFDLMIDASAGDLWTPEGYRLAITDNSVHSSEQFVGYWMNIIRQYGLRFLEDPFHEKDFESWACLTDSQDECILIGDNLYSSDAGRIEEGAKKKLTGAVVIKPNQAGTISALKLAIETAQQNGQKIITSHRSISTESTFLSLLSCIFGAEYIKIGPLVTDYSSVVRLNEIIRLTEEPRWQ